MACELVTGMAGKAHVTSAQAAAFNQAMAGKDTYVLNTKKGLKASIVSANRVRVEPGDFLIQGRHVTCEGVTELVIESGSQGINRIDLIIARYTRDGSSGIEKVELDIAKGEPASMPTPPTVKAANIDDGALLAEFPLYAINIDSLSPSEPTRLVDTHNYELASGKSNGWQWIKYANGYAECWGDFGVATTANEYFELRKALPFNFTRRDYAAITTTGSGGYSHIIPPYDLSNDRGIPATDHVKITGKSSRTLGNVIVHVDVKGWWK